MEGLNISKIEELRDMLKAMPEAEKPAKELSKREAVQMLSTEMRELQKRGYTIAQIAEALKGGGLEIASSTLKNYLQGTSARRKKTTAARNRSASQSPNVKQSKSKGNKGRFIPRPDTDDI